MRNPIMTRPGGIWTTVSGLILANIFFAVGIPYAIRAALLDVPADIRMLTITALGTISAICVAIWVVRSMITYPGAELGSYTIPAFALSFGALLFFFILTRLEYSRFLIIISFVISFVWTHFSLIRAQEKIKLSIGVLPFGNAKDVLSLENVNWFVIENTSDPVLNCDLVVTDLRVNLTDEWDRQVSDYALSGVRVLHYKHLLESLTGQVQLEHLYENSAGSLSPQPVYMKIKHFFDWIAAAAAAIILLPLMLVVAIVVAVDSRGPVLFRQERMGYRGETFRVFKFRTMRHGSNLSDARNSAMTQSDDARITRVGRFLRTSRIDELPQIINILRGEMSWIGPRPEAVALSQWYEQDIAFYRYRHIVRPGISGWAQVNQGHVTNVEDVRNKLNYDFYYIKNYSPWIDMLIVFKTLVTMATGYGAK